MTGAWRRTYKDILLRLSDGDMLNAMGFATVDQCEYDANDDGYCDDMGMAKVLFDLVVESSGSEIRDSRQYEVLPSDRLANTVDGRPYKICFSVAYVS